jgi:uncharacterized phage protein (TIGR02218 family)
MTYDARERSVQDGRPIEIFTFARDVQAWRYTSADRDVTVTSQVYRAQPISRSEIESTQEKARLGITITMPRTIEVAELYRVSPPTQAVTCIVQQYHEADAEVATLWTGRILSCEFAGAMATLRLEPLLTSIRRIGLRRMYQRQCPHVLYGPACQVNRESFRVDGTVASISGLVVNVAAAAGEADAWFAGGYLEYTAEGGAPERRFITNHAGPLLTVSSAPYGLAAAAAVKLYPGCDHAITTCTSKFSNAANYGGFPYFPLKNPFGGQPVF